MSFFSSSGVKISSTAYMMEFFDNKHRPKYITLFISTSALALVISPLLGAAILTMDFQFSWLNGFVYRPWRLFILITSLITGLPLLGIFFLPEGPSFSLAVGRHQEALNTLQTIYHVNTGRPKKVTVIKLTYKNLTNTNILGIRSYRNNH